VSLQKSPAEIIAQQTDAETVQTLSTLVRMGTLETVTQLWQAWLDSKTAAAGEGSEKGGSEKGGTGWALDVCRTVFQKHQPDAAGHTALHWAAKRTDDVRLAKFCCEVLKSHLLMPTSDATKMTALHWACTEENAIPVISYLLSRHPASTSTVGSSNNTNNNRNTNLLECRDGSGCTPLLIAAQYGHVETAAYLLQKKCQLTALDDSGDSATHWAAYKGSTTVLGLLSYHMKQSSHSQHNNDLSKPDHFGQTPLHLAALRGHVTACRYILQQVEGSCTSKQDLKKSLKALLAHKDKNGRTPEQLALHKEKRAVAVFLKDYYLQHVAPPAAFLDRKRLEQMTVTCIQNVCSTHAWKVWLGLPVPDADTDESPKFAYYYMVSHFVFHAIWWLTITVPVFHTQAGLLWDYMLLHVWNFMLILTCSYCFHRTTSTDPGSLDADNCNREKLAYWKGLYEETLQSYANDDHHLNPESNTAADRAIRNRPLCHTCHIVRPPRSKHDRFTRKCVLMFDHHCPFVGNTVGLYNYKWFYLVLLTMTVYYAGFWFGLALYVKRSVTTPWWVMLWGIYLGSHSIMSAGMLAYHTQLVMVNLTTNEHVNVGRYDYFWEKTSSSASTSTTIQNGSADSSNHSNHNHGSSSSSNNNNNNNSGRRYRNPWSRGSHWRNMLDRFHPSDHSYMLPEEQEHVSLLNNNKNQQQQQHGNANLEMV
jgi:ankyrin repeat protein